MLCAALSGGIAGCGRKGDPVAPISSPPDNVKDLRATLRCRAVELALTLPQRRADGTELEPPLRVEIYRRRYRLAAAEPTGSPQPSGSPTPSARGALDGNEPLLPTPSARGTLDGNEPLLPTPSARGTRRAPSSGQAPSRTPDAEDPFGELELPGLERSPRPATAEPSARQRVAAGATPEASPGAGSEEADDEPTEDDDDDDDDDEEEQDEEDDEPATATPTVPLAPTPVPAVPAGEFEKLDQLTVTQLVAAGATPTPGAVLPSAALEYVDDGSREPLEIGYTYIYQVILVDEDGEISAPSNTVQVEYALIPAPPGGLSAEVTETGVRLDWKPTRTDCTGERFREVAGYNVYRRGAESGYPATPLNPEPLEQTETTDAAVEFDRVYTYTVRAYAVAPKRESGNAEELAVEVFDRYAPAAASGLVVTRSKEGINLLWNPSPSPDVTGYHVYREARGSWKRLTTEPLQKTSFLDREIEPRQAYRYRVTAVDRSIRANESEPTDVVAVDEP